MELENSSKRLYSIGEVVDLTGVTHRMLRYYEKFFNLDISRDRSGNREYTEENIELLNLIIDMKNKGLKLEGIKVFLEDKSMLPKTNPGEVVLMDSRALEAKEMILKEVRNVIESSFKENVVIQALSEENKELKKQLEENELKMMKKMEELMSNIEEVKEKLEEQDKKPWYKKIFH